MAQHRRLEKRESEKHTIPYRGATIAAAGALLLAASNTVSASAPEAKPLDIHAELLGNVQAKAQDVAAEIISLSQRPQSSGIGGAINQTIEKNGDITLWYSLPVQSLVGSGAGEYSFSVRTRPATNKSALDPTAVQSLSLDVYTDADAQTPTRLYGAAFMQDSQGDWLVNTDYATKGPDHFSGSYTTDLEQPNGRTSLDNLTFSYLERTIDQVLQQAESQQPTGLVALPTPK